MAHVFLNLGEEDSSTHTMGNYHVAGTVLLFLSWIEGSCAIQPIVNTNKIMLLGSHTTWNNALEHCRALGGTLLPDKSPVFTTMLRRYRETHWQDIWNGTKAWLGLYVEDINIPKFTWAHNCTSLTVFNYSAFGNGFPSATDLDSEKLCMYKDFEEGTWIFDKCNLGLNAICSKVIGPCTFQRSTEQNVCVKGISVENITNANSQTMCEEICSNLQATGAGECWAVTYIPTSQTCVPSINIDPYAFEKTNNFTYENPCMNPTITSISQGTSVVSWRRCFVDPPGYEENLIPNTYPTQLNPIVPNCVTVPLSGTPNPIPIPKQEYSYPPTSLKRRLILLTDPSTFNDAAAYCKGTYNGTLVTEDSRAVGIMANTYRINEWDEWLGNSVWNGIFVSELDAPSYTYQGNCSIVNVEAFHRFKSLPLPGALNPSSLCLRADFNSKEWRFERCNATFSAVCEQIMGPCTFERDSGNNSCTFSLMLNESVKVADLYGCERYCINVQPEVWANGECWAVTYLPESGECVPAIDIDPLFFDKGNPGFQNPCQQDAITSKSNNQSVVSWKRCFKDPPGYDTSDICEENIPNDEPRVWCGPIPPAIFNANTSECSVTEQNNESETTSVQSNVQQTSTNVQPSVTASPTTTLNGIGVVYPLASTESLTPDSSTVQPTSPPPPDSTTVQLPLPTPPNPTTVQPTSPPPPDSTTVQLPLPPPPNPTTVQPTSPPPPDSTTVQLPLPSPPDSTTVQLPLPSPPNPTTVQPTSSPPSDSSTVQPPPSPPASTTSIPNPGPDSTTIPTPSYFTPASISTISTAATTTEENPVIIEPVTVKAKSPGDPSCSCTCIANANITLQEKTLKLTKTLTVNKDETSAHTRALTSATDDRPSARNVGITLGVGMIVGVLVLVSLGDIISVSKFLYVRLIK